MTDQELKDLVARLAVLEEKLAVREVERAEIEKERDEIYKKRAEKDARDFEEIKQIQRETDLILKRTSRRHEETERVMEKLGQKVDKVCGKMGGIDENLGHHAEQFFQDVFRRKKEFGGVHYDYIDTNYEREGNGGKMEIDIMLINGDSVALIEVKNRIHPDFVKEFAQDRVKKFRTLYPKYDDYKLYLGIAGFSFDNKALTEAKEYGVGIVKQNGDSVEIDTECLKAY